MKKLGKRNVIDITTVTAYRSCDCYGCSCGCSCLTTKQHGGEYTYESSSARSGDYAGAVG